MPKHSFNPRAARGRDLAKAKHDRFHRLDVNIWIVPSATSHHGYLVDTSRSWCTCPDGQSGPRCKHLWAAAFLENSITLIDGTRLAPPPVEDAEDLVASIYVHGGGS